MRLFFFFFFFFAPLFSLQNQHRLADLLGGLEDEAVLWLRLEWNTKLKELDKSLGEFLEENIRVLGVALDVLLELTVLDQGHISGKHHKSLGLVVSELGRAGPLFLRSQLMLNKQAKDDGCILTYLFVDPLLREEELEELVGHNSRAEVPRTVISGSVSMGTTQGVSTAEGNHFTVVKAHAAKNVSDMLLVLRGVGETAIWSAGRGIVVLTARSPWDGGTLQLLDGTGTGKCPEIRVGDPWEFGYIITNVSNTVMLNVCQLLSVMVWTHP